MPAADEVFGAILMLVGAVTHDGVGLGIEVGIDARPPDAVVIDIVKSSGPIGTALGKLRGGLAEGIGEADVGGVSDGRGEAAQVLDVRTATIALEGEVVPVEVVHFHSGAESALVGVDAGDLGLDLGVEEVGNGRCPTF